MTADDPRRRVIDAGTALVVAGLDDMVWGHVAVRDPDGRGVWIKRSSIGLDECTEQDVQLVGWDGRMIAGHGGVHIEVFIHLGLLRIRADADVSVHCHSEAVNAFSALELPLSAISHAGVLFAAGRLPRTGLSGDLVSDATLGTTLGADLGQARAVLMPRHGFATVGSNEGAAVMTAVLLEAACRTELLARSAGPLRSVSDPTEIEAKIQHCWPDSQLAAGYAWLLRQAGRVDRREHRTTV